MTVVDSVATAADAFFSNFNKYASQHRDGIIAILLLLGVIITFTGRTLLRPTVFLLGFIPTSSAIGTFAVALVSDQASFLATKPRALAAVKVAAIVVAVLLGVVVGIVMVRLLFRIATFAICAGFGAVLVLVLHLFLLEPAFTHNTLLIWWATMTLAALVAGLVSVSCPESSIILGTSFDGAALAVFSLARFLGHQPQLLMPLSASSPADGASSTTTGAAPLDEWWAVSYAAATVLLGIFGAITQRQIFVAEQIIEYYTAPQNAAALSSARAAKQNGTMAVDESGDTYGAASAVPYGTGDSGALSLYHPERFRSPPPRGTMPAYVLPANEERQHLLTIEPPETPPNRGSVDASPMVGGSYGALDAPDAQYSVVHNLGAEPLGSSSELYHNGKNASMSDRGTEDLKHGFKYPL